jgi:hypothetical protein
VDWDKDGDLDLLVGEKYVSVHYYKQKSDGTFVEKDNVIEIRRPQDPVDTPYYFSISQAIVDWNGDGKRDLVIGCDPNKETKLFPVRLYLNEGTNSNPVYDSYTEIADKSGGLVQSMTPRPEVVDLNLDGKKDLIVADKKVKVYYLKNVGTSGDPQFEDAQHKLVPNPDYGIPTSPDFDQNGGLGYGNARIYDWNQDGLPDLLLSGYTAGVIWIYINEAKR